MKTICYNRTWEVCCIGGGVLVARIVRNWVEGRASAFDGITNYEERNKESWVMLANARAAGPLRLTFSYVYQET